MNTKRIAVVSAVVAGALTTVGFATASTLGNHATRVQTVTMTVLTSDEVAGGNVALVPGVPVRIRFTNFSQHVHTFLMPKFHLNVVIRPARGRTPTTTTVTFTPREMGAFVWRCAICPTGFHGRQHEMRGTLYVIIDPSALP